MSGSEKSYSQTGEDVIICRELATVQGGTFLDIGAYHPITFSNTRRLYELGFKGVFVEPSPCLRRAFDEEYGHDPLITFLAVCVGGENGMVTFYDSGGDAISSTIETETHRWKAAYGTEFRPLPVEMLTVAKLLERCPFRTFDFINIDTEGNVRQIVEQFDFRKLDCKVVCLEWNGRDEDFYLRTLKRQGFREIHRNGENMIFTRTR